jgi:tRNA pseudouridine55 synthase
MGGTKEYIAEISFGKSTDTGDSYGRVTDASDKYIPCADEVKEALKNFLGNVVQQTPAFSAVKINGQKSYSLARRGIDVPAKPRDIVIHDIEYLGETRPESHLIRVSCGKGTYIRALCEDVGKSLGTPSFMSFLIRTKCAGFDITDAFTADELQRPGGLEKAVIPVDSLLSGLPEVIADGKHEKPLLNGGSIVFEGKDEATVRVYIEEKFVGIGGLEGGMLKITTLLTDR